MCVVLTDWTKLTKTKNKIFPPQFFRWHDCQCQYHCTACWAEIEEKIIWKCYIVSTEELENMGTKAEWTVVTSVRLLKWCFRPPRMTVTHVGLLTKYIVKDPSPGTVKCAIDQFPQCPLIDQGCLTGIITINLQKHSRVLPFSPMDPKGIIVLMVVGFPSKGLCKHFKYRTSLYNGQRLSFVLLIKGKSCNLLVL